MSRRSTAAGTGWIAAVLAAAALTCAPAHAQPATSTDSAAIAAKRPRVCLVLSGGGARGAAHVGVLKVLEALRVPIDCVTGTSMGSIVGAAYASGTGIAEMEDTLASTTTRVLFGDLPPREERSMHLKRDDLTNLAPPEVGVRDGKLLLPQGLVAGVQLESVLRRLSKVHGFHRFDELPIPFRAVATDLVTGTPVVLAQGELAAAMRASMSVPGAIAPVPLDGRLLVDGGLTNNLPIDVARALGADIVIAVNLGTPLLRADELTSVLGVTNQMVKLLTDQNVRAALATLKPTDILVLPQLGDFSAADFDHLAATVPIGEAAARAVADRLAPLSVSAADYDAWQRRRQGASRATLAIVDEVRLQGLERVNPEMARSAVEVTPGTPFDQQTLDRDLRRLYGTGDFERVNYQILEEPGKRILSIEAVEKSWGPNYLRFGLGLSTDFGGDAFFNLLASYRMTWLNRLGGEWRTDAQFGRSNRIGTEFYQPVERSQTFFVVPSTGYEQRAADVFDGKQRIARYDIGTATIALQAGAQFNKYGEVRLGLESAGVKTTLDTGPEFLRPPQERAHYNSITLQGRADQLDNVNFPREGYAGSFNVMASRTGLGSDASFTRGEASGSYYASFGDHTISGAVRFGGRLGSNPLPPGQLFQWGGLLQQSGYPTGALLGEELMFGRVVYLNRLFRSNLLPGIYTGVSLEVGRMRRPLVPGNDDGVLRSAALLLGLDTPLGPLYFGYGRANHGFDSLYLFLGKP